MIKKWKLQYKLVSYDGETIREYIIPVERINLCNE